MALVELKHNDGDIYGAFISELELIECKSRSTGYQEFACTGMWLDHSPDPFSARIIVAPDDRKVSHGQGCARAILEKKHPGDVYLRIVFPKKRDRVGYVRVWPEFQWQGQQFGGVASSSYLYVERAKELFGEG